MVGTHWLWSAYVALGQHHHLTAEQSIRKLEELYPGENVRTIVQAMGSPSGMTHPTAVTPGPAPSQAADPTGLNADIRRKALGGRWDGTLPLSRDDILNAGKPKGGG